MKELLEPIFIVALTIGALGIAAIMPMIVWAAYRELIKGEHK